MKVTLMELPKAIKAAKEQFQPPDFDKLNVSYLEGEQHTHTPLRYIEKSCLV